MIEGKNQSFGFAADDKIILYSMILDVKNPHLKVAEWIELKNEIFVEVFKQDIHIYDGTSHPEVDYNNILIRT